jgi:predicted amidophosphoribosyltransferase
MIEIKGPWKKGYAFDIHTKKSEYMGENEYGYPQFNSLRSQMGQWLYELKYKQDLLIIDKIIGLLLASSDFSAFITGIDVIIPVPPSNKHRNLQPVVLIAQELARNFKKELRQDILISSNSEEIKNIDASEKYDRIKSSITINGRIETSKRILVFDDVLDSGSTLTAIANILIKNEYSQIFAFTLTKTRKSD